MNNPLLHQLLQQVEVVYVVEEEAACHNQDEVVYVVEEEACHNLVVVAYAVEDEEVCVVEEGCRNQVEDEVEVGCRNQVLHVLHLLHLHLHLLLLRLAVRIRFPTLLC